MSLADSFYGSNWARSISTKSIACTNITVFSRIQDVIGAVAGGTWYIKHIHLRLGKSRYVGTYIHLYIGPPVHMRMVPYLHV